jgi:hypothetical protein
MKTPSYFLVISLEQTKPEESENERGKEEIHNPNNIHQQNQVWTTPRTIHPHGYPGGFHFGKSGVKKRTNKRNKCKKIK